MGENFSDQRIRDMARGDLHDALGTRPDVAGILATKPGSLTATLGAMDGKTWWETANRLTQPTGNPEDPNFKIVPMGHPQPGQMEIPCLWSTKGTGDNGPPGRPANYYCSGNAAVYKMQHPDEFKK